MPTTRFTVAQQLLEHIFQAELEEGVTLPSERELCRQFHVSRGVLRESLRLLEFQGLIAVRPGRGGGIQIRRPTVESVARDLALVVRWERTTLAEVIRARAMLEAMCVRELCRSCLPSRLRRLRHAAARRGTNPYDFSPYNRFHHVLVATANNRVVTQLYRGLFRALYVHLKAAPELSDERHDASVRAHEAIVDAIEARDADLAERLVSSHIESHRDYMTG